MHSKVVIYHHSCRLVPRWQAVFISLQTEKFFCCGQLSQLRGTCFGRAIGQSQPRGLGEPHLSPVGCKGSGCAALAVDKPADGDDFCSQCCQSSPLLVEFVCCLGCREKAVVTWCLPNSDFSSLLSPVALRTSSCLLQQFLWAP